MKKNRRIIAILLCLVFVSASMTACSTNASEEIQTPTGTTQTPEVTDAADASSEVISDETATLKMYGPGLFTEVGEDGTTDMVTGLERPGYKVLVERWNELYPNVTLEIEPIPWDNWKAAVQTAALSGDYDILIHGNGNADYCLDLTSYIEADPEVKDSLTFYPYRRNPEDMTQTNPYGLSYALNPVLAVIDKQILQDYNVELPDETWTLEDIVDIAQKTTGMDPVSGTQTYGISMIKAADANKNYILMGRAFNNVIFDFAPELKDTKVNFATEKTAQIFDYLKTLGSYSSPDYLEGLDLTNAYTADSNIAMIWSESVYNIYNKIKVAGLEDRYMFLPLPQIQEGEDQGITSSNVGDLNIAIYKDSKQKDLAWSFLKFLVTDPVAQQWLIDTNTIPSNINSLKLLYDVMPADYADAISEVISTNPEGYNVVASSWYDSTWFGTFQSDIITEYDLVMKDNETSEQAVQNIQNNIDSYLQSLN
jgi:multiple sugar transport system substrate-binding protein